MGDNLPPPGLDATGIGDSILLTPARFGRVTNSVIRIGGDCASEQTMAFTIEDRERLWDDFINEFDSIELHDGNGSIYSPNTNLRGCKCTIWLHEDSMSGIPHLYGAFSRSAALTGRNASTMTTAHLLRHNVQPDVRPRNETGRQPPGYGRRTSGR